ncbi:uncharacterized protein [Blastocystis hominis]|uniref:Uncharacterized protein n=1 Tax=Blastocystis hominis TaxID=12968 RepID=D8M1V0_BLAHO|nr:uncharacterized protein [Blastocystis hominis]CBK22039.2 unnamed protein product [Blastocystis hominis]|eukprot:XP_012896087.1 uncharacterized protein [Blastocystis hominis]
MKKGFRSGRKKQFAKQRSEYYFAPVDKANREKIYKRLLVNTYLNNASELEAVKMVIEGEAPVESLESKQKASKPDEKRPFAFIERTWEVKNPTEEELFVATAFCIVANPWSLRHPLDRGREHSLVNPLSMTFFALTFEVIES